MYATSRKRPFVPAVISWLDVSDYYVMYKQTAQSVLWNISKGHQWVTDPFSWFCELMWKVCGWREIISPKKGPMSLTFQHKHPGIFGTESPQWGKPPVKCIHRFLSSNPQGYETSVGRQYFLSLITLKNFLSEKVKLDKGSIKYILALPFGEVVSLSLMCLLSM